VEARACGCGKLFNLLLQSLIVVGFSGTHVIGQEFKHIQEVGRCQDLFLHREQNGKEWTADLLYPFQTKALDVVVPNILAVVAALSV
jgi:hypothetical protein